MPLTKRLAKGSPLTATEHDNNLTGLQGGGVASIAALQALDTSIMADGLKVMVDGQGLFVWSAASTAESDGISCFVPDGLQSAQQTNSSLSLGAVRADQNEATRSIGHANLIFGSVEVVYSDGKSTQPSGEFVTDWDLHGASLGVLGTGGNDIPHLPEIDHLSGAFTPHGYTLGTNFGFARLRKLINDNTTAGTFTARYKYATGAGRWLRVMEPGAPYTPRMIGCTPDDDTVNDYNRLAWLMVRAIKHNRPILIDAWYHYKGTLEFNDGIEIRQDRPWPDAGLKVCPWSTIPPIDHLATGYDANNPDKILDKQTVIGVAGIAAKNIRLRGLHIHGNLEENTDFIDNEDYDEASVTNTLRNSPTWCGFAVTVQDARQIEDSLRVYMDDVQIGDFGGSCLIGAQHTRHFVGKNVALGVSSSGRIKYGGSGDWQNLWLYGYSRTAITRAYTENVHGFRYTWFRPDGSIPTRIWPEVAIPENVYGQLSAGLNDALGQPRGCHLSGVDWDMTGSDSFTGFNLRGVGNRISGRVNTPANDVVFRALQFPFFANEGACNASIDLDIFSRGTAGVSPMICSADGAFHYGSDIKIRIHETYDDTGEPSSPAPTLPTLPSWGAPQVCVDLPGTLENEAFTDRQTLTLDIQSDLPFANVINLLGMPGSGQTVDAAEVTPTIIRLSGRIPNVTNSFWPGMNGQGPAAGCEVLPVRVLCEGLTFNVFDPGTAYVGGTAAIDNAFEVMKLRGCRTFDELVSEQDGLLAVAGSELTTDHYDISTELMWRPRVITVTPVTADAQAHMPWVEVIKTGSGTGSSENFRNCTLRFHFTGSPASGADLQVRWSAAVAPW